MTKKLLHQGNVAPLLKSPIGRRIQFVDEEESFPVKLRGSMTTGCSYSPPVGSIPFKSSILSWNDYYRFWKSTVQLVFFKRARNNLPFQTTRAHPRFLVSSAMFIVLCMFLVSYVHCVLCSLLFMFLILSWLSTCLTLRLHVFFNGHVALRSENTQTLFKLAQYLIKCRFWYRITKFTRNNRTKLCTIKDLSSTNV